MHLVLAAGGTSVVVLVIVFVLLVPAIGYALFSRGRSQAITEHPRGEGHTEDPGVGIRPSQISSADEQEPRHGSFT